VTVPQQKFAFSSFANLPANDPMDAASADIPDPDGFVY